MTALLLCAVAGGVVLLGAFRARAADRAPRLQSPHPSDVREARRAHVRKLDAALRDRTPLARVRRG